MIPAAVLVGTWSRGRRSATSASAAFPTRRIGREWLVVVTTNDAPPGIKPHGRFARIRLSEIVPRLAIADRALPTGQCRADRVLGDGRG